jgi:hypothetical protein
MLVSTRRSSNSARLRRMRTDRRPIAPRRSVIRARTRPTHKQVEKSIICLRVGLVLKYGWLLVLALLSPDLPIRWAALLRTDPANIPFAYSLFASRFWWRTALGTVLSSWKLTRCGGCKQNASGCHGRSGSTTASSSDPLACKMQSLIYVVRGVKLRRETSRLAPGKQG